MGIYDPDPVDQLVTQQQQEQKKNLLLNLLSRAGDIVSRPSYALGNVFETAVNQFQHLPGTPEARDKAYENAIGATNPLAALWEGLSGKDKVGLGDALRRQIRTYEDTGYDVPGILQKAVDNPVTAFAFNLGSDPTLASGALGGGRITKALEAVGQGEDAGRLAKIAGRMVNPETLQNLNIASQGARGAATPLAIPGGALIGLARKSQKVDDLIRALYEGKQAAPTAASLMDEAIGLADEAAIPANKLMEYATKLAEEAKLPVRPTAQSLSNQGLKEGLRSFPEVKQALALNPAPIPIVASGAPAANRAEALMKFIKPSNIEGSLAVNVTRGRSAAGAFMSAENIKDAQRLQDLLADPNTRTETLKMLQGLISGR